MIHPETAKEIETLLKMLEKYGEDKTFRYIRYQLKKHK